MSRFTPDTNKSLREQRIDAEREAIRLSLMPAPSSEQMASEALRLQTMNEETQRRYLQTQIDTAMGLISRHYESREAAQEQQAARQETLGPSPPLSSAPQIPEPPIAEPPTAPSQSAPNSGPEAAVETQRESGPNIAGMLAQLLSAQQGNADYSSILTGLVGPSGAPQRPRTGTDTLQSGLDIAGVFDPTPVVDTVNAGISLVRAFNARNPEERREHLVNAGISAVAGWVPYWGDTAKIPKYLKSGARSIGETAKDFQISRRSGSQRPPVPPTPGAPTGSSAPSAAGSPPGRPPSGSGGTVPPTPPPGGPTPPGGGAPGAGSPPPGGAMPPGSPPPPPPPPPGGGPPVPPSGGSSGGGWGSAAPFVAGLAGGALASWSLGYEPSPLPPRRYGFFDPITNPAQRNMASDIGSMAKRQTTAMLDVATNPISPGAYLNLAKATFDNIRELPGAIMSWAESLKESQERLRMFSGQLANVFMESEWREMMREFRSAGRTAGTTTGLVKALDDLKDDLQPFKDLMTNIANSAATIAVRGLDMAVSLAKAVTYLDELTTIANWWFSRSSSDDLPPAIEMWRSIRPRDTETRPPRRPPI